MDARFRNRPPGGMWGNNMTVSGERGADRLKKRTIASANALVLLFTSD